MKIRKITPLDNSKIEKIIKDTILEFGLPTKGSAYEDTDTKAMFEGYQNTNEVYFVLEVNNEVVGGGGIKQLNGNNNTICELQKMYLHPKIRGKGYGIKVFTKCMEAAKKLGYLQCYLESDPGMTSAIKIYEENGFKHLDGPIGNTGHTACGVWMLKEL